MQTHAKWLVTLVSGLIFTCTSIAFAEPVKLKGFDEGIRHLIYDPGSYTHFMVAPIALEFDAHWLRDNDAKLRERDQQRIKSTYSRLLREELTETFAEQTGLTLSSDPGPQTLIIHARLERFKLNAPEHTHSGFTKHYVNTVGAAEIHFEVQDHQSTTLISAKDYQRTRSFGGMGDLKETNRVQNRHDFKLLYRRWADRLAAAFAES